MSLTAGDRLGPYEIVGQIGVGGMGQVYHARDTRVGRDVAIKVVQSKFSERFEREARAIAALNHPNICHLYDVGPDFLVMELIDGRTIAEHIKQGPIPLRKCLTIALQVSNALEAAHEKGIIHRDLKPANIKLQPDGTVKVLDFGLAKIPETVAPESSPEHSPTLTMENATTGGMILGTAAYMAPEQATGKPIDKRADIWAFGVVLYEMVTGRRAFTGETITDVLASVVKEDPDLTTLPAQVRLVVARCLSKDPRTRWGSIGDVRWALEVGTATGLPQARSQRRPSLVIAALVLALAAGAVASWFLRPKPDYPLLQLEISAPENAKFEPNPIAPSPDGRRVVFGATGKDGKRMLWMRPLEAGSAAPLPGTEDANGAFWSPDSRWVAFIAGGKLQKIDVTGGQPQVICEVSESALFGDWNSEGVILIGDTKKSMQRIAATGGTSTAALKLDTTREEHAQVGPAFLPDGKHFLFASIAKEHGVALGSLDGKPSRFLFPHRDSPPSYAPNPAGGGWILYSVRNRLMALPFDPGKGEVTGEAAVIVDPISSGSDWNVSRNGVLAFRRDRRSSNPLTRASNQLTWFSRDGKPLGVVGDPWSIGSVASGFPRISPDQSTIVFSRGTNDLNTNLWLFDTARRTTTRFTSEAGIDNFPVWSPDGSRIYYYARRNDERLVLERPVNGIGPKKIGKSQSDPMDPTGASHDGHWLVVEELTAFASHISLLSLTDGKSVPVGESDHMLNGSISPDGRWLLYDDAGQKEAQREVFVQSLPREAGGSTEVTGKFLISTAGGATPVWRSDGKEIFYLAPDGKMIAVPVEAGKNFFRPGTPKPLFQTHLEQGVFRDYDVTSDGQRFLLNVPTNTSTGDTEDGPITVIVNWPKLLQK
jgi:serine/threonine protein kinase